MSFPEQAAWQEASQSTTILVLGILGIVCSCGPLAIVAWVMGNNETQAIDAGGRDPANRSTANAGRIVGTALFAITIVWLIFLFAGAIAFPIFDDFGNFS